MLYHINGNFLKRFLLLIIWVLFVSNFIVAWAVWHVLVGGEKFNEKWSVGIIQIAKIPSQFYHVLSSNFTKESNHLKIINSTDSITINNLKGYFLLSAVNSENNLTEIKLIDINQNNLIKRWNLDAINFDNYEGSKEDQRFFHPLLLQGDIITQLGGTLLRISNNSSIIWKSKPIFHHSIEIDSDGNLWTCGTIPKNSKSKNIQSMILDDALYKLNPLTGKIVFEKSIFNILIENGYTNLINYLGPITGDPIHLNDVQPALSSGKYWEKGDLLISLRHRSTVFLYRPSTNKVIWLKMGPWSFQHDCDFINDHEIGIFGNDIVIVEDKLKAKDILINGHNNQYIYNFETDEVSTPYSNMFKQGKIKTRSEGRSRVLPDGRLLVEETNYGRILLGDKNGLKGTYVSRLDKYHIAMLGWSRYYTREEYLQAIKK